MTDQTIYYREGDRVRALQDYGWSDSADDRIASAGDLGTVVASEKAANPENGELVTVKWDRTGQAAGIFSFRVEKIAGSGEQTDPLAEAAVELAKAKVARKQAFRVKHEAEEAYEAAQRREQEAERALNRAVNATAEG